MIIKVRWVIVNPAWEIFLCKGHDIDYFILPGWTLEEGELIEDCLEREFIEEFGVKPVIGPVFHINDFFRGWLDEIMFDICYKVENYEEFNDIDLSKASHGHENVEVWFYNLDDISWLYKPENLPDVIHKHIHST